MTKEELLIEIRNLHCSSEQDYNSESYESYAFYVTEYNRLIVHADSLGVKNLLRIENVPEGERASFSVGSVAEIAKLREVVNKSNILLQKLEAFNIVENDKINIDPLILIFNKFHIIAQQLIKRYDRRSTINIIDEYDVQDLLHSLLKLYFDDIRTEEWTPSYAGGAARMDFLLKNEKIVIETKKTRSGLGAKEVGDQLLIDIAKYSEHKDCTSLICFIYDPEGRINNPRGIENDLNKRTTSSFTVNTYIRPTGQ